MACSVICCLKVKLAKFVFWKHFRSKACVYISFFVKFPKPKVTKYPVIDRNREAKILVLREHLQESSSTLETRLTRI